MQVNQFIELLKESKPKFFRLWKFFSFFIPFLVILEIGRRNSLQLQTLWSDIQSVDFTLLVIVFLLVPINWGLEAYKWFFLMQRFGFHLSYQSACKTTLTGLAYSLVLPGGIGEYIGRAEVIPSGKEWRGAGVLSIARIAQMYATVLFGGLTLGVFLWHKAYWYLLSALVCFVVFCLVLFVYVPSLALWVSKKLKGGYFFITDLLEPWTHQGMDRWYVFLLSAVRYAVFTFQFYMLLIAFGVQAPTIDLLSGISSAFLLKSFFPSFLDLGPRELAVMLFFEELNISLPQVLGASLLLWFLNVMLPGLTGSLLTLRNFILHHYKTQR